MKELKTKRLNITLLIISAIALVTLFLGGFFDLKIATKINGLFPLSSSELVNAPLFSVIMTVGIVTSAFFGSFGGTLLITSNCKTKFWTIVWKIAGVLGFGIITYSTYNSCLEAAKLYELSVPNKTGWIIGIAITVLLIDLLGLYLALKAKKSSTNENRFWVGLTIVALITVYFFVSEIVKYSFSRPRPRIVFSPDSGVDFRNWWNLNFLYSLNAENSSAFKSFPSGHVANCSTSLVFIPLILSLFEVGKKKWSTVIGEIICTAYIIVMGVSRLFAQAHFLSDVAGGMILIIILGFLEYLIIPRIRLAVEKRK